MNPVSLIQALLENNHVFESPNFGDGMVYRKGGQYIWSVPTSPVSFRFKHEVLDTIFDVCYLMEHRGGIVNWSVTYVPTDSGWWG